MNESAFVITATLLNTAFKISALVAVVVLGFHLRRRLMARRGAARSPETFTAEAANPPENPARD